MIMVVLQMLYTYTPFMNTAFQSAPLEAWMWLPIMALGLVAFLLVELEKVVSVALRRRHQS